MWQGMVAPMGGVCEPLAEVDVAVWGTGSSCLRAAAACQGAGAVAAGEAAGVRGSTWLRGSGRPPVGSTRWGRGRRCTRPASPAGGGGRGEASPPARRRPRRCPHPVRTAPPWQPRPACLPPPPPPPQSLPAPTCRLPQPTVHARPSTTPENLLEPWAQRAQRGSRHSRSSWARRPSAPQSRVPQLERARPRGRLRGGAQLPWGPALARTCACALRRAGFLKAGGTEGPALTEPGGATRSRGFGDFGRRPAARASLTEGWASLGRGRGAEAGWGPEVLGGRGVGAGRLWGASLCTGVAAPAGPSGSASALALRFLLPGHWVRRSLVWSSWCRGRGAEPAPPRSALLTGLPGLPFLRPPLGPSVWGGVLSPCPSHAVPDTCRPLPGVLGEGAAGVRGCELANVAAPCPVSPGTPFCSAPLVARSDCEFLQPLWTRNLRD